METLFKGLLWFSQTDVQFTIALESTRDLQTTAWKPFQLLQRYNDIFYSIPPSRPSGFCVKHFCFFVWFPLGLILGPATAFSFWGSSKLAFSFAHRFVNNRSKTDQPIHNTATARKRNNEKKSTDLRKWEQYTLDICLKVYHQWGKDSDLQIQNDFKKLTEAAKTPCKHQQGGLRALASHNSKTLPITLTVIFQPCSRQELQVQNMYFKIIGVMKLRKLGERIFSSFCSPCC